MTSAHRSVRWVAFCAVVAAAIGGAPAAGSKPDKPSLVVTASQSVGFTPIRIVFSAELKGGDEEQLYCPTVEWRWGDDTKTVTSHDCDPYEAGKSEVRRRWVVQHVFQFAGEWRVELRLKQKDRVVAQGSTTIRLRPGAGDGGEIIR